MNIVSHRRIVVSLRPDDSSGMHQDIRCPRAVRVPTWYGSMLKSNPGDQSSTMSFDDLITVSLNLDVRNGMILKYAGGKSWSGSPGTENSNVWLWKISDIFF